MSRESDLYDPLNTKTIGGDLRLDVDTYENVQDNIHVEGVNRKLLELTDLIGRVTNNRSDSGPIPGTAVVEEIQVTTSGTKVVGFLPNAGEVYQLYAFCVADMTGRSGSCVHEVFLRDNTTSRKVELVDVSAGSSVFPLVEAGTSYPIFVDENIQVMYECTGTFTDSTLNFIAIRVR
jgi:hypothetical protein